METISCYGCGKLGAFSLCDHCAEIVAYVRARRAKLESTFPFIYKPFPVSVSLTAHAARYFKNNSNELGDKPR